MKRLTDKEVAALYRGKAGGARQADHLQIREDVKRLAKDLREWMTSLHPADCGCGPCAKTRALLSEVGQ